MKSRLISEGARASRLAKATISAPPPEVRIDLDSLPVGASGHGDHAPLLRIQRPRNALSEELRELGRAAAPLFAKLRAGLITVRPAANGRFDVDGGDRCPPPCNVTLVRGVCPVCGVDAENRPKHPICFALGKPRVSAPRKADAYLDTTFGDLARA